MFLGRVVLPGDPAWTEDDRAKVLAVFMDRAGRCSGCGQHESDVAEHGMPLRPAKFVPISHRCFLCTASDKLYAEIPSEDRPGVTVRVMSTKGTRDV